MRVVKILIILAVIGLLWGCATVRPHYSRPPQAIEYFDYPPIYETLFVGYETMLLIFEDDTCVSFSSYERARVGVGFPLIEVVLEELNKDYSNIKLIVHNHFWMDNFSDGDLWFHHCIKLRGFKGQFQLFFVPKNMVTLETK